jgi:hypothetical protein
MKIPNFQLQPGSNMVAGSREFYHSIRPERSEYSALGKQPFYLLRFTPDGSRLLALDAALKEVRIYAYRGVHQAAAKAKWGHNWELFEVFAIYLDFLHKYIAFFFIDRKSSPNTLPSNSGTCATPGARNDSNSAHFPATVLT